MDDSFELLEEKVRRAADLVRKLRRENRTLEDETSKAKARLQEAEKRLSSVEKQLTAPSGPDPEVVKALEADLKSLRAEREEVRKRIGRLVEILDGLD